jgi:pimeloyl-ACP methyl ester carboxylesterase
MSITRSAEFRPIGFRSTEYDIQVPLDHDDPNGPSVSVFCREIAASEEDDRPYLLYLEGGPGHEAPRAYTSGNAAWLDEAMKRFNVILMDQRGTGRSTPVEVAQLQEMSDAEQVDYLRHFRADTIVKDAEKVREMLGIERWTVVGASFGGFCILRYLSAAPEGLAAVLIAGGLPPVDRTIDEVYGATYRRVSEKYSLFLERYPGDAERIERIEKQLADEEVLLPSGDRLTTRRFRQLGWMLGMGNGAERLHYLLETPLTSRAFLVDLERALPFNRNPLYFVMQESCWANGERTTWAAERMLKGNNAQYLTAEHVYPWMMDEYGALSPYRPAAEGLAAHDWPALYDVDQLEANEVPAAAVIYADDMYVDANFSQETAARVAGLRYWLTNEYQHDGLVTGGRDVFCRLLEMSEGNA